MTQLLVTITAPHYTASIIVRDEKVVEAAPILRWTRGKPWRHVWRYLNGKGYTVTQQPDPAIRASEIDFSGCPAIGVGGYHSDEYDPEEGGQCQWCGAGAP